MTEYGAENGGVASFTGRAARGTETNPTALMANDRLASFRAHGFTGNGFSLGANAGIEIDAAEDWSDTDRGTYMLFETTPNGASSRVERMRITDSGNIGIGTTTPTSLLHVNGTFTATSKNFQIDHPLDPAKKFLVHSALEGPEVAVYYRGEAQLVNGEVEIALPSYFEALTRKEQRTVQLTPIKGWSPLYVSDEIQEGRFTVRSAGATRAQRFYWEVKAVRADIAPLVVEKEKVAEQISLTTSR